ncbi:LytR/AlgR family response regulator transcription factor [Marinoscillum pacificum]|uniref:LytR/AlgR family response regulator transcription factor n=1 Tax=Marinoscillum pacificum TaxID=392723 RepID=UPI0021585776|nr:LytTR family DNA-binding domain-containing protein [Marinoscillum pacificum]
MKIKCIAIDDEPLALEKLVDYIGQVPFFELLGSFENGLDALVFLQDTDVDLIFLDIQMPQILGTQLVQVLTKKPQIIFSTAYSEYAVDGFELDVTDYLLKPLNFRRFLQASQKALQRAKNQGVKKEATVEEVVKDYAFVKTENRLVKVMLDDILYIEGLKDYLSIYTSSERILTLQSFAELQSQLSSDFVRIHKSYLIPIAKIDEIEKNRVRIGDKYLPIGETYRKAFMTKIN